MTENHVDGYITHTKTVSIYLLPALPRYSSLFRAAWHRHAAATTNLKMAGNHVQASATVGSVRINAERCKTVLLGALI